MVFSCHSLQRDKVFSPFTNLFVHFPLTKLILGRSLHHCNFGFFVMKTFPRIMILGLPIWFLIFILGRKASFRSLLLPLRAYSLQLIAYSCGSAALFILSLGLLSEFKDNQGFILTFYLYPLFSQHCLN